MVRTTDQVYDELEKNAHDDWKSTPEARAVLKGLATVLSGVEERFGGAGGWLSQSLRSSAVGRFLDEHAEMYGVERRGSDSDESLSSRSVYSGRNLTADYIRRELEPLIPDGYLLRWSEPNLNCSDGSFFTDDPLVGMTPAEVGEGPAKLVFVLIPRYETIGNEGLFSDSGFSDVDSWAHDDELDPGRYAYKEILKRIQVARVRGVRVGAIIAEPDLASAWFVPLFTPLGEVI